MALLATRVRRLATRQTSLAASATSAMRARVALMGTSSSASSSAEAKPYPYAPTEAQRLAAPRAPYHKTEEDVHRSKVRTLYRRMLRTVVPHFAVGKQFFDFADQLRQEFEKFRDEKNPTIVQTKFNDGYHWIKHYSHTFPYIPIWAPGGTSWQRNVPPPLEIMDQEGDPYAPENQWKTSLKQTSLDGVNVRSSGH